jgi:hypothetical protein
MGEPPFFGGGCAFQDGLNGYMIRQESIVMVGQELMTINGIDNEPGGLDHCPPN